MRNVEEEKGLLLEQNSRKEDEQELLLGCMGRLVDNQASISPNVGEPLRSSRGILFSRLPRRSLRETFLEASIEVQFVNAYLFGRSLRITLLRIHFRYQWMRNR